MILSRSAQQTSVSWMAEFRKAFSYFTYSSYKKYADGHNRPRLLISVFTENTKTKHTPCADK